MDSGTVRNLMLRDVKHERKKKTPLEKPSCLLNLMYLLRKNRKTLRLGMITPQRTPFCSPVDKTVKKRVKLRKWKHDKQVKIGRGADSREEKKIRSKINEFGIVTMI